VDVYQARFDTTQKAEFPFAFFSDIHIDSANHAGKQFAYDIQEAVDRQCRIYIGGDLGELILPGDHKRYSKGRDIIEPDAALNMIQEMYFDTLRPYVDFIDWIGWGNHEDSALKYNNYDVIRGVITLLNHERAKDLPPIHHGGYKSYIRWRFSHGENRNTKTIDVLHFHGKGGSSPVTKGMIDVNRLRAYYDADVYWLGHKHTNIADPDVKVTLAQNDQIRKKQCIAFFTAGYQEPFKQEDYNKHGYTRNFEDTQLGGTTTGFAMLDVRIRKDGPFMRLIK
jgi:hypothetical protein